MAMNTIAAVSEKTLKIQAFLEQCAPGTELSFLTIENRTGVVMNEKGKQYLRRALKRAKIEYSPDIGRGIKLANPENTMPIVIDRLKRIDNTVKRAEKTQKNLQEQFFEQLSPQEQKQLLFVGAAFGAIRVAAENGKLLYQTKNKMQKVIEIPIPQYN